MHARVRLTTGLGLICLTAAAIAVAPSAVAGGPGAAEAHSGRTCYSNLKHVDTFRTMSQNFAAVQGQYDSAAADDVDLRKACTVTSIRVIGAYSVDGAVDSETVTFYTANEGRPDKVISTQTVAGTDLGGGSYDIDLQPVTLKKGISWVSVVANLNPDRGGQWYWTNSLTERGAPAQWENPRGGWQYGCLTWTRIQQCLGSSPGQDLLFALGK